MGPVLKNEMATPRLKRILLSAFAAIGSGLVLLVLFSVLALHQTQQALIEVSNREQAAQQSVLRMMDAARERLLILHSIHASRDPFEIDRLITRFYERGTDFAGARQDFVNLEVEPEDVELLTDQEQLQRAIVLAEAQIIDLVRAGEYQKAERLLIDDVHPRQNRMLQLLGDVLAVHTAQAYQQTVSTTRLSRRIYLLMLLFGALGAAVTGMIAYLTIRHVSGTAEAMEQQADRLRESLKEIEYLKLATDQHNIVSVTNASGTITHVNDQFTRVSQYSPYELIGKNHRILRSGVHDDAFFQDLWDTISSGQVWKGEICNRRKDGGLYWVATTIVPFLDENGLPYQYVSIRTDITRIKEAEGVLMRSKEELERMVEDRTAALAHTNEQLAREVRERKKLQQELEKLATTDTLTGLANRREFNSALTQELGRAERYHTPVSLIFLDLDYFKRINDLHGHQAGDEVLRDFSALVLGQVREQDILARWGGEEFALLCPNTALDGASQIAEKLRCLVRQHDFPAAGHVTCSLGVAQWREGEQQSEWVARVDAALYKAKGGGRDQVVSDG